MNILLDKEDIEELLKIGITKVEVFETSGLVECIGTGAGKPIILDLEKMAGTRLDIPLKEDLTEYVGEA